MKAPVSFIVALLLAGCNSLLGITDPKVTSGDADGPHDAPVDVTTVSDDRLEVTIPGFSMTIQQAVHLHVKIVHKDGTSGDVTAQATWSTGNSAIAVAATTPGEIDGISMGTTNVTASLGDAMPSTISTEVTGTTCHVMINELQAGGAVNSADEWVEIINPCTSVAVLDGFKLAYRAAGNTNPNAADTNTMITLAGNLEPGGIQVFSGPDFPGTKEGNWSMGLMKSDSGAVAIRDMADAIVDSVAYGSCPANPFIETAEAPGLTNGKSIARLPFDGHDLDDNSTDFQLVATPTPHAPNAK